MEPAEGSESRDEAQRTGRDGERSQGFASQRAMTQEGIAIKARALAYLHHPESFLIDHLVGTGAGAVIASLVADLDPVPPPAPHPDAALIDGAARWIGIEAEWNRPGDETVDIEQERSERQTALLADIVKRSATTLAGLKAKARVLVGEADWSGPGVAEDATVLAWAEDGLGSATYLDRITASLVLDVFRLAAEAGL